MNRTDVRPTLVALSCLALLSVQVAAAAERLGTYPVDPDKISVSGISSGAFMANQLHIAHSTLFMGAAMVAGGLYGCAVNDVKDDGVGALASLATGPCMSAPALLDNAASYAERVKDFQSRHWIDPIAGLEPDKVYLFTGSADSVVASKTVLTGADVYAELGVPEENILVVHYTEPPGAGHSWVTDNYILPCNANTNPYINNCQYDQAGAILQHIYGELKPRAQTVSGTFHEFSQLEFAPDGELAGNGLWDVGYLYVPRACEPGGDEQCPLHVVLHGCAQSAEVLDDTFYRHVGVNEWADSNGIVVLYPQARSVTVKDFKTSGPSDIFQINPFGCWNWWGYAYDDRYLLKSGVQLDAIYHMVLRVIGSES